VQRICGTGIEVLSQACDAIAHKGIDAALCVGAESMSRNPVAAYTHRGGFRMGQVEFKDFLWEALLDPSCDATMGDTAENLASQYSITRAEVDAYAERSFARVLQARAEGFFDDEIVAVSSEIFYSPGRKDRAIKLDLKIDVVIEDSHPRATSLATLAKIRPTFGGVQTGGNSSAVVDGAAGAVVVSGAYLKRAGKAPLARLIGAVAVGCPPHIMGIGPAPSIRALLERTGLKLAEIDRIEINEAFGAQVIACMRELGLDEEKLNVNGGAIAIGHPLGATGLRLTLTLARELKRRGLRYGIASACIGGGQGIAMLIENGDLAP
jgi:acetyl-CoA C-acetyltransferase